MGEDRKHSGVDKPKLLQKSWGLIAAVKLVLGAGALIAFIVLMVLGRLFGDDDHNVGYKSDW